MIFTSSTSFIILTFISRRTYQFIKLYNKPVDALQENLERSPGKLRHWPSPYFPDATASRGQTNGPYFQWLQRYHLLLLHLLSMVPQRYGFPDDVYCLLTTIQHLSID